MAQSLSIEARLARIEEHLGIETEPAPAIPPAMTMSARPLYQEIDVAAGLEAQIVEDKAELILAIEEVALWESGDHPQFPDGPKSNFRPSLLQRPDRLRRSIAAAETRLAQLKGARHLGPNRAA